MAAEVDEDWEATYGPAHELELEELCRKFLGVWQDIDTSLLATVFEKYIKTTTDEIDSFPPELRALAYPCELVETRPMISASYRATRSEFFKGIDGLSPELQHRIFWLGHSTKIDVLSGALIFLLHWWKSEFGINVLLTHKGERFCVDKLALCMVRFKPKTVHHLSLKYPFSHFNRIGLQEALIESKTDENENGASHELISSHTFITYNHERAIDFTGFLADLDYEPGSIVVVKTFFEHLAAFDLDRFQAMDFFELCNFYKTIGHAEFIPLMQKVASQVHALIFGPYAAQYRACGWCGLPTTSLELQQCARCKAVAYCDRVCQKLHWKAHKAVCVSSPTLQLVDGAKNEDE